MRFRRDNSGQDSKKGQNSQELSAAAGAAITFAQREEARAVELANKSKFKLQADKLEAAKQNTAPLDRLVNRLSKIDGVEISFESHDQITRVNGSLNVGNRSFSVIVEADDAGYSMHENVRKEDYELKDLEPYEGGSKSLDEIMGSVAMVMGTQYPEKAKEIDTITAASKIADKGSQQDMEITR